MSEENTEQPLPAPIGAPLRALHEHYQACPTGYSSCPLCCLHHLALAGRGVKRAREIARSAGATEELIALVDRAARE
jgi:hypothetical protein